jgi:putative transposase
MPNFRRTRDPGGTFFFTLVTDGRAPILCDGPAPALLRDITRETRARWPFEIEAMVVLPDHFHTMWTLPDHDTNYSIRLAWLKKEFTKRWLQHRGAERARSLGRTRDGRREYGSRSSGNTRCATNVIWNGASSTSTTIR